MFGTIFYLSSLFDTILCVVSSNIIFYVFFLSDAVLIQKVVRRVTNVIRKHDVIQDSISGILEYNYLVAARINFFKGLASRRYRVL